jgi:hypothetical protein
MTDTRSGSDIISPNGSGSVSVRFVSSECSADQGRLGMGLYQFIIMMMDTGETIYSDIPDGFCDE